MLAPGQHSAQLNASLHASGEGRLIYSQSAGATRNALPSPLSRGRGARAKPEWNGARDPAKQVAKLDMQAEEAPLRGKVFVLGPGQHSAQLALRCMLPGKGRMF